MDLSSPADRRRALADLLRARHEDLLQRWERRVLADPAVPEAPRLRRPALRDHLPKLIDDLVAAIERFEPGEAVAHGRALGDGPSSKLHALHRTNEHYSLPAMLRELSLFRDALLELCAEVGVRVEGDEARLVHAALDDAMYTTVVEIERATRDAEAALRQGRADLAEREERMRFAVEAAQVGTWELDPRTRSLRCDARGREILGLAPDVEGPGAGAFFDAVHPDDRARVREAVERGLDPAEAGGLRVEFRVRGARDGAERWASMRGRATFDDQGAAARLVGTLRDVTERARAELAARVLSEASTALASSLDYASTIATVARLLVTHLGDYCMIDLIGDDGRFERLELAARDPSKEALVRRAMDYPPSMAPDSPFRQVLETHRPRLVAEVTPSWLDALAGDPVYREILGELAPRSAMLVPLVVRGRAIGVIKLLSSDPGRTYDVGDLAFAEDLGARAALAVDNARLYREAREALALVDTFVSSAPVGFALLDRGLRYVRVNETLAAMTGMPVEECLGRAVHEVDPGDAQGAQAALRRVLETGEAVLNVESRVERASSLGDLRHLTSSYYPVRDPDGSIEAIGVVVTDITERTRTERELREDAAFRERFVGILGHDLRTPLSAVMVGTTLLLRQEGLAPPQARVVRRIAESARRMERMVGDLLDFTRSRHRAGIPVSPQPMDLHELCGAVIDEIHLTYPDRNVEIATRGDGRGTWDPDRIAQLVSNLVVNALDYSPAGTPVRLTVAGNDDSVFISVHNLGAPIPPEAQATLFDPFRRGMHDAMTARPSRGLGLGLFIVAQIVKAHGGSIEVRSGAEGTSFNATLPRWTTVRASSG